MSDRPEGVLTGPRVAMAAVQRGRPADEEALSIVQPAEREPCPEELVVISEHPEPPRWVLDWCDRSGCRARIERARSRPPSGLPNRLGGQVAGLAGRPVLVVRPTPVRGSGRRDARVAVAVRDLAEDDLVLRLAARVAVFLDATLVIVHAVPRSFAERSIGLDTAVERGEDLLATATASLRAHAPGLSVTARLLRVRPHELVHRLGDIDLLVVGEPAARPLSALDQVANAAVHHGHSSVLLVPRARPAAR